MNLKHMLTACLLLTTMYSCSKEDDFEAQGGQLPTHYINILDSSFSPSILTIANGNSVTFLNKTSNTHTIVSDDSATILSPALAPNGFYYVKPDTIAGSAQVYIYYHCKEHPSVKGTIVLMP